MDKIRLYHGSPDKIDILKPRFAKGMEKDSDRQVGVYATDNKDKAIVMALIHLQETNLVCRILYRMMKK